MNAQHEAIPYRRRYRGEFRMVFSGPPPVLVTTRVCSTTGCWLSEGVAKILILLVIVGLV